MDKKELMEIGNAAIRKALSDMFVILDEDGNMLSKIDGDRMVFSPRLECDKNCSALLFDDVKKANGVIEEILFPQNGKNYNIFKFTSIDDDAADSEYETPEDDYFEIEFDSDDENDDGFKDEMWFDYDDDDDDDDDDDEISIDDEIKFCKDIAANLDSEESKEYEQIVSLLEELKEMKEIYDSDDVIVNSEDGDEDEDSDDEDEDSDDEDEDSDDEDDSTIKESFEISPVFSDAQKIFKRNGYELVSQRGYRQEWVNESKGDSFILPYSSVTNGRIDHNEWNSIVNEHNLELDV